VKPPNLPKSSYFICTNPRSGSWLLAEGLAATEIAGNPREWFQEEEARKHCEAWGVTYSPHAALTEYLPTFRKHGTRNGVFGAKVMYYQFREWSDKIENTDPYRGRGVADVMATFFPNLRYVWLRRRDTARQAISYHRATQTDEWWRIAGEANPARPGTAGEAAFDPEAIARLEEEVVRNDLNWQAYFDANGITPLALYYEDLAADYIGVIVRTLRWLGLISSGVLHIPPPRLAKQADAQTEEWAGRYAEFKAAKESGR
jgi:LPS sulfotransferase NodH